ncbi:MAG: cytochrome c oxidase subunit II [Cyanobacteria bacterium]|nr:cytochrome c oxidase subunit II [Cyanobacteriota bacterium]
MKQIPAPLWTLTIGVAVTLLSLWYGQNHGLMPEQASEQAVLIDELFDSMVVMGTALFLVMEGAILYCMIQFRQRKGDETDGPAIEGNLPLEAFWTAIPTILVIGLGLYSFQVFQEIGGITPGHVAHDHGTMIAQADDTPLPGGLSESGKGPLIAENSVFGLGAPLENEDTAADLQVNVTGMQYAWIFTYPEGNIIDGELHVPIGADVQLNISAKDVIHSFWVPQFRLKQDAIPGKKTALRFIANKEGNYPVVCAELCGGYHGSMRTQVIVHSPEDYQAWHDKRVAQTPAVETIAKAPADLSAEEYLSPYSQEMGVNRDLIANLSLK